MVDAGRPQVISERDIKCASSTVTPGDASMPTFVRRDVLQCVGRHRQRIFPFDLVPVAAIFLAIRGFSRRSSL